LNIICDFFNRQICKNNNSEIESLDECYSNFFKKVKESYLDGSFELEIPFDEQLDLYESISDSTFNNLWVCNNCWISGYPDTLKCIGYRYDGKVELLLKELSSENQVLNNYYEIFKLTGEITPSTIGDIAVYYEKISVDDIRVKLLVVLHYLTLNDELKRNVDKKSAPNNGSFCTTAK